MHNHKPDVKVMFQPGGKSNFSLGWDNNKKKEVKKTAKQIEEEEERKQCEKEECERLQFEQKVQKDKKNDEYGKNVKTSVKVHAPPGGKSNFRLG